MLKKGPEINLKDIKVPAVLQDLYHDLKDRHLLPLVALLVVAIVAVPIALGQSGSGEPESEAPVEAATATPSVAQSGSGELVAKATPGLRDYRKRLDRMEAEDPFVQQFKAAEAEEGEESAGSTGAIAESTGTPALPIDEPSTAPPVDGDGEPDPDRLTYYSYAIDVRVVPGNGSEDWEGGAGKPQVRRDLPELTMLPSRDTPAIVYMGSTKDGKKALMMVSSNVEAIFGDATCALGSDSCQLLVMEPGIPTTFVYGGEGRTFKIELLKVHLVETDKLNRAPLGKPKNGKSEQGEG